MTGEGDNDWVLNDMDEQLLKEAQELVGNGERIPADKARRIIMAIALDNRNQLLKLNGRLDRVEQHPFHQLSPKNITAIILSFLALSSIYIKETRDFLVEWLLGGLK